MAKSIFQKRKPEDSAPTPYERIGPEIAHLKKGSSTRYGAKGRPKRAAWLIVFGLCALAWLYIMDPVLHAWYKGEAIRTYLYLHNFGSGKMADELAACQILSPEEITALNGRTGSFQDYYSSPEAANRQAEVILHYLSQVQLLHSGNSEQLDPVGRVRRFLFIQTGLVPPTQWDFLEPSVQD